MIIDTNLKLCITIRNNMVIACARINIKCEICPFIGVCPMPKIKKKGVKYGKTQEGRCHKTYGGIKEKRVF